MVCSKCQYIFSFSAIENFYTSVKSQRVTTDLKKQRDLFIKSKPITDLPTSKIIDEIAVPVDKLPIDKLEEICKNLKLNEALASAFENLGLLYNFNDNILYFPMHDVDNRIIGYKKLFRQNNKTVEETLPESRVFGTIIVSPGTKKSHKEVKTAILVLNIPDVLTLRMQHLNCK